MRTCTYFNLTDHVLRGKPLNSEPRIRIHQPRFEKVDVVLAFIAVSTEVVLVFEHFDVEFGLEACSL